MGIFREGSKCLFGNRHETSQLSSLMFNICADKWHGVERWKKKLSHQMTSQYSVNNYGMWCVYTIRVAITVLSDRVMQYQMSDSVVAVLPSFLLLRHFIKVFISAMMAPPKSDSNEVPIWVC